MSRTSTVLRFAAVNAPTRMTWDVRAPWTIPDGLAARAIVSFAAVGLIASYLVTWQLWVPRQDPPNLAGVSWLSSMHFAIPLVVAALVAIALPRGGAVLHTGLLFLAVLGDQVRLQPEFVSLAILLVAASWPATGLHIARWHVLTLWGWAGIHKVLSAGWPSDGAAFIANAAGTGELRPVVAAIVPVAEIGLALLAIWRRWWPLLRIAAPLFHIGVVLILAMADWNTAVWPWNLALAAATPFLFRSGRDEVRTSKSPRRRLATVSAVLLAAYPLGFYVGVTDAYLAHNLYTSNTAEAYMCDGSQPVSCAPVSWITRETLNVPLPPERRVFLAWFREVCRPSQRLRIDGIWTRLFERSISYERCPSAL